MPNEKPSATRLSLSQDLSSHEGDLSDETLLNQVKANNKNALGLLFRRHAIVIRQIGLRILRDEGEADDLL
jgi:hypothetical protein